MKSCSSCGPRYSNLSPEPSYIRPRGGHYPGSFRSEPSYLEGGRYQLEYESKRNEPLFSFLDIPTPEVMGAKTEESYRTNPAVMNRLYRQVSHAAKKTAETIGSRPRTPDYIYLDECLPPTIGGYAVKNNRSSAVGINPRYIGTASEERIANHEGAHLAQPGLDTLHKFTYATGGRRYQLGTDMIEGHAQRTVRRAGLEAPHAYPIQTRLAEKISNVANLDRLFFIAEFEGPEGVQQFLSQPAVADVISKHYETYRYQQAAEPSKN